MIKKIKTQTKIIINLDTYQSKQLEDTGECFYLEPIKSNEICDTCYIDGMEWQDKTTTIGNVNVIRIQEIHNSDAIDLFIIPGEIPKHKTFKAWFNSNFSQPTLIECMGCNGKGYADLVDRQPMCEFCNGDGIESWICYVYDPISFPLLITHRDEYRENEKYESTWLGKPLRAIVNPFCYVIKIKIDNEKNK